MRETAARGIAKLVQMFPELGSEAMPSLLKALNDSDEDVRQSVLEGMVEVVKVSPGLAGEAVPSMLLALMDRAADVRKTAAKSTFVIL